MSTTRAWAYGLMVALMFTNVGVQAATYKWKDENGQTHYTQSPPPPGIEVERVGPPPKVDTERAVEDLKAKEEAFNQRREEQARAATEGEQKEATVTEKAKYCEELRADMQGLQTAQRIFVGEGDERRRMTEEERLGRIEEIEQKLAKDCA